MKKQNTFFFLWKDKLELSKFSTFQLYRLVPKNIKTRTSYIGFAEIKKDLFS